MAASTSVSLPGARCLRGRYPIAGYGVLLAEVAVLVGFAARYDAFDFHIYALGGHAVRHGLALYQFHWRRHGFTYPPFAAVVFLPLTFIPTALLRVLWDVSSVAALALTWRSLLRLAGIQIDRAGLAWIVAASFLLQPVWNTLFLGQINLLLLGLVVGDLQRAARGRTTGLGIGIAAAIKLTPLIFLGVLLLAGRVKSALLAAATFGAASLTGYLIAPQASSLYWSRYLLDTSRIGDATYISNQSPYGSLARLLGGTAAIGPWFLLLPAVLGATGLAVAVSFARRDDWLAAAAVAGVTALLTSPISWSHHWVWALPAVPLAARSGPTGRRWATASFGFGVLAPQWWMPARLQSGLHGPVTVIANSFTLAGLAFLGSMSLQALRLRVHNAVVDVELLVVPDCPSQKSAASLLRTALDDIGLARVEFRTTVVDSPDSAVRRGFTGSPTFLIDGADLFADPGREPAVACRMYDGPDGPAGVPELPDLRRALKRHAASSVGLPA